MGRKRQSVQPGNRLPLTTYDGHLPPPRPLLRSGPGRDPAASARVPPEPTSPCGAPGPPGPCVGLVMRGRSRGDTAGWMPPARLLGRPLGREEGLPPPRLRPTALLRSSRPQPSLSGTWAGGSGEARGRARTGPSPAPAARPAQGRASGRPGAAGPHLHQLPPVLPRNSFFSEFQMNFFQLPSSLAFPRAMAAGQRGGSGGERAAALRVPGARRRRRGGGAAPRAGRLRARTYRAHGPRRCPVRTRPSCPWGLRGLREPAAATPAAARDASCAPASGELRGDRQRQDRAGGRLGGARGRNTRACRLLEIGEGARPAFTI